MLFSNRKVYLKSFFLIIVLIIISLVFAACTGAERSLNNSKTLDAEENTYSNNNLNRDNNSPDEDENTYSTKDVIDTNENAKHDTEEHREDTKSVPNTEVPVNGDKEGNKEEVKEISFNSITLDQLHPLTLAPAKPFTEREVRFKNHTFPTIGTYYNKDWRYQVVEINGYGSNPKAVIDIGNTGDKPMVLTNDNICFVLMAASGGSGNIAGSKLHGAPVTINPGEIKRVTITASHTEARSLEFRFSGEDYVEVAISDYNEKITDATPFEDYDEYGLRVGGTSDFYYPSAGAEDTICGNGKLKFLVDKVIITDLKQVGGIKRPEGGAVLLAKVVLANTSDEIMEINWVATQAVVIDEERKTIEFEYTDKEWKALGSKALPRIIQPDQIVEGYIAAPFYRGRDSHSILFKSTHGWFVVSELETYPVSP